MPVLTKGIIAVRPIKLRTDLTLEEIAERAEVDRYDSEADQPGTGWGGPYDDTAVLGEPVVGRLTVGTPIIVDEDGEIPRRLRMRYYYDHLNKPALRSLGDSSDWRRIHTRQAVDIVVLDDAVVDDEQVQRTALVSLRDAKLLNAIPATALGALLEIPKKDVVTEDLPESLDPDFFTWLLYQLNQTKPVGDGLTLQGISEMHSRDRYLRGARFTERANMDRIEMAALIVMGDMRFGPAKMDLSSQDPAADFEVELNLDGGFTVMRGSRYKTRSVDPHLVGHALVDDMWSRVLPRMRHAYNADDGWRRQGRDALRELGRTAVRAIL
jgi:hypothetical protein